MAVYKHISYRDEYEECYLDLRIPEGVDEFYTFVYFHGGGLTGGGSFEPFLDPLAKLGVAVVSTQYRMYPNAKFPDYIEDSAHAVAWTVKNIERYGKCKGIYVGGSSAGSYISQMLCFDSRYLREVGVEPMSIAGYIHDAGQPTTHFHILSAERGVDRRRIIVDEAAPLYHVGKDSDYPPMLFIVSDNDMANRLEQTELMISTLRDFGHKDPKIQLRIMHGTHCAYVKEVYPNGTSPMANLCAEYIFRNEKISK